MSQQQEPTKRWQAPHFTDTNIRTGARGQTRNDCKGACRTASRNRMLSLLYNEHEEEGEKKG